MQNLLEGALSALRDEMLSRFPRYCSCQQCKDDVLTWALNHTRPKYVTGSRAMGNAVTNADLAQDQSRAELTVIVLQALSKVAANPRHGGNPSPQATR